MDRFAFACLATLALTGAALAQDPAPGYPAKPIRIIVPFPAGGSADLMPRSFAEKLAARWGQPVVVENRAGAGGNIGAEVVYKAEPDGHTLLSAPPPPLVINPSLYPKLGYDASQFVPVTIIGSIPNVMLVHPKVTAASVQEFIALARENPDRFNYASQGSGTTSHLAAEMFKSMAGGLRITHVPYRGTAPALVDLLAGQVDLMFDNLGVSLQHVRSGKLKALAVGSEQRFAGLPDVPAMAELLPGFVSVAWFGVVAPPKTPSPVAEKLSAAIAEALKQPDVARRLESLSAVPIGSTPPAMAAFMKEETERYRGIIRAAGVKVD
jgi:tripartite-type tricarboxylate transporter receptor subunit TctC